jgi:DNA ligase-1
VKVVLQVFDLLYMNGKSLLAHSLRVRRQLLKAAFTEFEGQLYFAKGADHVENGDTEPIEVRYGRHVHVPGPFSACRQML